MTMRRAKGKDILNSDSDIEDYDDNSFNNSDHDEREKNSDNDPDIIDGQISLNYHADINNGNNNGKIDLCDLVYKSNEQNVINVNDQNKGQIIMADKSKDNIFDDFIKFVEFIPINFEFRIKEKGKYENIFTCANRSISFTTDWFPITNNFRILLTAVKMLENKKEENETNAPLFTSLFAPNIFARLLPADLESPNLRAQHEISNLNENDRTAFTPNGLYIDLFAHQLTALRALLDFEDTHAVYKNCQDINKNYKKTIRYEPDIIWKKTKDINEFDSANPVLGILPYDYGNYIVSPVAYYCDLFGAGKTFTILSLILTSQIPRIFAPVHWNYFSPFPIMLATPEREIIKPTLIIVGSAVLSQWETTIEKYTNLSYFTISDLASFGLFKKILYQNKINCFDVILVKAKKMAYHYSDYQFFLNNASDRAKQIYKILLTSIPRALDNISIITAIALSIGNRIWSRIVYDDYDIINQLYTNIMPSLSVILVSATVNKDDYTKRSKNYKKLSRKILNTSEPTLIEWQKIDKIDCYGPILMPPVNDRTKIIIKNNPSFIKKFVCIPMVKYFITYAERPDRLYYNLLSSLYIPQDIQNQVKECINAGAIGEAAALLNIKAESLADIFSNFTSFQNKKYKIILQQVKFLQALLQVFENQDENENYSEELTKKKIRSILKYIEQKNSIISPQIFANMKGYHLKDYIREHIDKRDIARLEIVRRFNRIKENIAEKECQICYENLSDPNNEVFINKCCGFIICADCVKKGNNINIMSNSKINITCPNCMNVAIVGDSLIMISAKTIDDIIECDEIDKLIINSVDKNNDTSNNQKNIDRDNSDKLYLGIDLSCYEEFDASIKSMPKFKDLKLIIDYGLADNTVCITDDHKNKILSRFNILGSGEYVARPTDICRKIIIVGGFSELVNKLEKFLSLCKFKFAVLKGSVREIANTIDNFRNSDINILIINSYNYCAGFNAEFISDIIFMHNMLNENKFAQILGRMQRANRTFSGHVHYLAYRDEEFY